MNEYDPKEIEKKWQDQWEKSGIYWAKDDSDKPKYYTLIEFPYPSGDGLHVGHPRPYIGLDVVSRKRRMEGKNVLYPIGWDAFGLPTENYAIKTGRPPAEITKENTDTFRRQIKSLGVSFDWSREINTTDPRYYKWTQWIFLKLFEKGLAYKAKMPINWCPKDKIGLANEEVLSVGGQEVCERCGTPVEQREKEQWMLAITKYADRLEKDLDDVDYPERVKIQQKNWIGRSEGAEIEFPYADDLTPNPLSEGKGEFGYHTTDPKTWHALQDRALAMRDNPTEAENVLWQSLRKKLTGYHFRRQQIIGRFIVDFVCLEKKLIVEVDGDIHDYQREEDKARTEFLSESGFEVMRFKNDEVLNGIEAVVKKITARIEALPFGEGWGGVESDSIKVFTTRPDTIFGATFLVKAGKEDGFTGKYVTNPATEEKIPVWEAEYVMGDYGTGAIMGVPAHDERDYEFAKKHDLPIKQVIEPVFENITEHGKVKSDLPVIERDSIMAIVKHWAEDKYIGLRYKNVDWRTLITGGPENGQDALDGAVAEIVQETGYLHPKFVRNLNKVHSKFYHVPKKINRFAHFTTFYFELEDGDKQEVSKEEKKLHEVEWLTKEEMANFLSPRAHKYVWESLFGEAVYEGEGILTGSKEFDGLSSEEARKKITEKFGKIVTKYKLRDWVFSRQRYWGEPIPVVHCEKCGVVPVPEKDLPVLLPEVKNYLPTYTGESPLANIADWVNTTCPKCGGKAKRETDTMPNWAGSSWYFLAYCISENLNDQAPITKQASSSNIQNKFKYWMPVDWYNGGMEHTVLHLLYSRFWNKFLFDIGVSPVDEPYKKRTSHGLILAEGGEKMSKSKGNVVNPDAIVERFGADTLRVYEMFMGPFEQAIAWSESSLVGPRRFLEKVWKLKAKLPFTNSSDVSYGKHGQNLLNEVSPLAHKTIKKVSEDIETLGFNTAVSTLMIFVNELEKREKISREEYETLLKLLAPFAPHITEDLWSKLGFDHSIHLEPWPQYDETKLVSDNVTIVVQVNGKVRGSFEVGKLVSGEEVQEKALELPEIKKWVGDKRVEKTIYVPGKLVNIVVS
jgi:leucyl-tRNA synthetase/very-short-patch-repair endonuclease